MRRRFKIIAFALLLGLAAAQLIQPDTRNPSVNPARSLWHSGRVSPRVADILQRACADCHSYKTEWPWYAKISPVSWLLARHVSQGRAKLNFDDWSPNPDKMEEIYDSISKDKMPISSYILMHPEARLSQDSRNILLAWVDGKL